MGNQDDIDAKIKALEKQQKVFKAQRVRDRRDINNNKKVLVPLYYTTIQILYNFIDKEEMIN